MSTVANCKISNTVEAGWIRAADVTHSNAMLPALPYFIVICLPLAYSIRQWSVSALRRKGTK